MFFLQIQYFIKNNETVFCVQQTVSKPILEEGDTKQKFPVDELFKLSVEFGGFEVSP